MDWKDGLTATIIVGLGYLGINAISKGVVCELCEKWGDPTQCKGDVKLREIAEISEVQEEHIDPSGIRHFTIPGLKYSKKMSCMESAEAHNDGVSEALCMMNDDLNQIDHWSDAESFSAEETPICDCGIYLVGNPRLIEQECLDCGKKSHQKCGDDRKWYVNCAFCKSGNVQPTNLEEWRKLKGYDAESFSAQYIVSDCDGCGTRAKGEMNYCSWCEGHYCNGCDHWKDFTVSDTCEDSYYGSLDGMKWIDMKNAESFSAEECNHCGNVMATSPCCGISHCPVQDFDCACEKHYGSNYPDLDEETGERYGNWEWSGDYWYQPKNAESFAALEGQRIPNLTMEEWNGVSKALGEVGTFHNWIHEGTDGEGGDGTTLVVNKRHGVFGRRNTYVCDGCGNAYSPSQFPGGFRKHEPESLCEYCEDKFNYSED